MRVNWYQIQTDAVIKLKKLYLDGEAHPDADNVFTITVIINKDDKAVETH